MSKKVTGQPFTMFENGLFLFGEIPIGDHLDELRNQALYYRGILAEIQDHDSSPKGSILVAEKEMAKVINALYAAHEALRHYDEAYNDARDKERESED